MKNYLLIGSCLLALLVGCGQGKSPATSAAASTEPLAVDGAKYILSEQPADAANVIQVRQEAQDGDEIVIVGRIGGSGDPWIAGRAAFSIVDRSIKACTDIPGDTCPTPWDYCCETPKLPTATALVKFVDDDGQLIKADARRLLNVKELMTVVVTGTAKRDDAGNLTVLGRSIYAQE